MSPGQEWVFVDCAKQNNRFADNNVRRRFSRNTWHREQPGWPGAGPGAKSRIVLQCSEAKKTAS